MLQEKQAERKRAADLRFVARCLQEGFASLAALNAGGDTVMKRNDEILAELPHVIASMDLVQFFNGTKTKCDLARKSDISRRRVTGVVVHAVHVQLREALEETEQKRLDAVKVRDAAKLQVDEAASKVAALEVDREIMEVAGDHPRDVAFGGSVELFGGSMDGGEAYQELLRAKEELREAEKEAVRHLALEKNLPTPPVLSRPNKRVRKKRKENPARERRKGRVRRKPQFKGPRKKPVRVSVDPCPSSKGQRNVTTFPYAELSARLHRLICCHKDLRTGLVVREVDGHRSSLQASPVHALLMGESGRMDRTNPDPSNLPPGWNTPPTNFFKIRFDPLLGTLINRDALVPFALAMIDIADCLGLDRLYIFQRIYQARATRGGGRNGISARSSLGDGGW